jgi:hypothetical protein
VRNYKATFERKIEADQFTVELFRWEEICREYVGMVPLNGRELIEAEQVQAQTSHKVFVTYGASMAQVTTKDRMKIRRPVEVNEAEPEADENYRLFEIESIVNVGEANRELLVMVVERR